MHIRRGCSTLSPCPVSLGVYIQWFTRKVGGQPPLSHKDWGYNDGVIQKEERECLLPHHNKRGQVNSSTVINILSFGEIHQPVRRIGVRFARNVIFIRLGMVWSLHIARSGRTRSSPCQMEQQCV